MVKEKEAVKKEEKSAKRGMRFWLPGIRRGAPPEFRRADVPFPSKGEPARYENLRVKYHNRPLAFVGEIFIDDPEVAKYLIQNGGAVGLRWEQADAEKFLGPDAGTAPATPEKVRPNLHLMNQPEILAYANDEGIYLDAKLPKDKLVEALEAAFAKKEKKK